MSHTLLMEKHTSETQSGGISLQGIMAINSLGGPPLPVGETDIGHIKVTLENQAAANIQYWQVNVANMSLKRR